MTTSACALTSLTSGNVAIRARIPRAAVKRDDAVLIRSQRLYCVIHMSPRERSIYFRNNRGISTRHKSPLNLIFQYDTVRYCRGVPFYYYCSTRGG